MAPPVPESIMFKAVFFFFFYLIVATIQAFFFSYSIEHLAPVVLGHPVEFAFWKCYVLAIVPLFGQLAFPAFIIALLFGV